MGDSDGEAIYISAQAASDFGETPVGSATGDLNADGGTIEILGGGDLFILNGNQSATNLRVDGTDYALTYDQTFSGYDAYTHSATFVVGEAYTVVVT